MTSEPTSGGRSSSRRSSFSSSNPLARSNHASLHVSFSPSCSSLSSRSHAAKASGKGIGFSSQDRLCSPVEGFDAPELHNYETYTFHPDRSLPRITSSPTNVPTAYNTAPATGPTNNPLPTALDLGSLALLSLHDPYRLEHSHLEKPDDMDEAFRQHANPSRRKNRSSTHLDHLSLAPLTSRLPFSDADEQYLPPSRSYLEGKSAPTTPGILGGGQHGMHHHHNHHRTPLHPSSAAAAAVSASLPKKSRSANSLQSLAPPPKSAKHRRGGSGNQTPTRHHHHRLAMTAAEPATDRDWLEHTGALLSDSAREYKGQAWLVSRDSSTSLTAQGREDDDDERRREDGSRWNSEQRGRSGDSSASNSHVGSRVGSRIGSRVMTPLERGLEGGYFPGADAGDQAVGVEEDSEWAAGPNFVNLDESLEASALGNQAAVDDEAAIRSLVQSRGTGVGGWIGGMVGWRLFSVDEGGESEEEVPLDESELSRTASTVHFEEASVDATIPEERSPPPADDDGGWRDAAWLLSVASKVLV